MKNRSGYEVVYDQDTPAEVINWIEYAYNCNKRIRVFHGDTDRADFERVHHHQPDPGKDWGEENMVTGTIGISTGWKPCFLLIANSRSMGGPALSTNSIVRILIDGREVYRHPNYHSDYDSARVEPSELASEGYTHAVVPYTGEYAGQEVARFKSERSAKNYLAFMKGERMAK